MAEPSITIIIPYYKNSDTIFRALTSVYKQTIQSFEILIINDASPDWIKAETLIQQIQDERLQVIHHSINMNGAAARNTGIKVARGKYIAFLDADDEWNTDHLESSLNLIERDNTIDLVFSRFRVKSGIEYVLPNHHYKVGENIGDFLFVKQQAIFTPSIFLKTSIAKDVLFNEGLKRHQDYDFLLRFYAADYKAAMSNHIGGIVYWENNNIEAKGGTWQFSLSWAKDYKLYLSKAAYTNFIIQFVIIKLLAERKIIQAFKIASKEINPRLITIKSFFLLAYPFLKPLLLAKNFILKKEEH